MLLDFRSIRLITVEGVRVVLAPDSAIEDHTTVYLSRGAEWSIKNSISYK